MSNTRSNEVYRHNRLTFPRSIRVLALSPSLDATAPLEVSLAEIDLDNATAQNVRYEALSYVWGARTGDRPLLCEGKSLLVTRNCESALRHLRQAEEVRVMWVDAICIDQGDGEENVRERNAQIALMGEVYHNATRTICWLGDGTEFTGEVMTRLERIGVCQSKRELKKIVQFDSEFANRQTSSAIYETQRGAVRQGYCAASLVVWTIYFAIRGIQESGPCRK